jgi:tetratricopeptide (TPR) repeat protein
VNFVYLFFFAASWIVIQCLIGGTRLLFSLPAYCLLAVGAILTLASLRARRPAPSAACILTTLLLGAWVLVRSKFSPIEYLALPDFYMMIGCLMAYLLTAYYLTGQLDRAILIGVLWAIAGLEVWCGLIQFLKDENFMLFGLMRGQNLERASGMFISPNHFAGFLETVAILSLSMAIWSRWPLWSKALAIYMALSCWLGVAISGSRGGYFSTVASLVVFCGASIYTIRLAHPKGFGAALLGSVTAVLLMVGVAVFLMGHSRLLTHRMQTMMVKDVRIYNWEAALDHIRVSPWFGTGSGTHLIYGRLFRRSSIQADPVHAHCDYLELVAEYGAVGGVLMLLFIGTHVWNGLRGFSEILRRRLLPSGISRSNGFAFNLGALCAVAALAVHSVVDFNMHIPGNALLYAFIFGMLANPGLDKTPGFLGRRVVPVGRLVLPALGVWMFVVGLPLLPSEWCAEQSRQALRDQKYLSAINYAKLGLGTFQGEFHTPDDELQIFGRPWTLWFGGLDAMIKRFGPNPKDPDFYFYIGEANRALANRMPLFILKRRYYENAIQAFNDELKVFPQDENAVIRLAQCHDALFEYQAAEQLYQQAFHLDPHLGTLYGYYVTHLTAEGRTKEAVAAAHLEHDLETQAVDAEHEADNALK